MTYTAANQHFDITDLPLAFIPASGPGASINPSSTEGWTSEIHLLVGNNGVLIGGNGPGGADLFVSGEFTYTSPGSTPTGVVTSSDGTITTVNNGDGTVTTTYDGILLDGSIGQFGYSDPSATAPAFDFRFTAQPGALLDTYFANSDIGALVTPDNCNFQGSFANDFNGQPKAVAGPIPPLKSTPTISTSASSSGGSTVGSALLTDSVTIAGGNDPTGMVTFTLTDPQGNNASTQTITVNGDGTYVVPTSILATQVGTYTWNASYAGDSFNNGAVDNGANESFTTVKAIPSISTKASETTNVVGTAVLSDSVTVNGGDHPTGTVSFTLSQPDGTTIPEGSVTINGDGTYTLSPSILATEVGTYTFHASYAGDSLNNGAIDNGTNESVSTVKASPSISTKASESGNVVGTATLTDSVTVTGGDSPTGTVSFTLTRPDGTTVPAGSVAIAGDGTYTLSPSIVATEVGTYTFHANYAGDSLNNGALDNGTNESVSTIKASPSISTKASENGNVVNVAQLSDSVTVAGGDNPTGTVTFTLSKPDGTTVPAGSVTITGDGTYTVSPSVLATEVGTYIWHASYAGDSLNNGAVDQGGAAEQLIVVAPPGFTISGTKYDDLTGNGFSADDTPLTGMSVKISLYADTNHNGTYDPGTDVLIASTMTSTTNGTYSFNNLTLPNGTYFAVETVPSGWVETGPGFPMYNTITVDGTNKTGVNFDDFQEECNLSKFSCIYYVINGCQTVTELSGNVQPGDEVTAYFTVAANYSDSVSLVSYIAPDNYFNANDANQQVIYDQKTLSFTTGSCAQTFCLGPVQIPLCDYQIDFVCGPAINTFGPAGSNVFYHPENRIFDSSNGGCQQCSTTGSDISGIVYCDGNLDKTLDCCEDLICGATVSLETTGGKVLQTTTTGSNGSYAFENLAPGTYLVVVTPPGGDTAETTNTITVVLPNKQDPQLNPMGNDADLNFAELCHCSAIQGSCWDDCNNDGKIDYNECGVICVTINLSGVDCLGNKVSLSCKTDDDGDYCFSGLLPGCYTICEGQPGGFTQGTNTCGTVNGSVCGSKTGTDTFCNVQISNCGDAGIGYNFGEHCTTNDCKGACASTSFWKNSNGQALLCKLNGSSNSCALGQWLSNTFPDMYSHVMVNGTYVNFANLTNAQIAWFFVNCDYNVYTAKLNTQVLAAALNCYATSTNLCGGTYAAAYGFTTSANGSGYDLINVGSNGAAFGVSNNSNISILQALNAADSDAVNGVLYATSEVINGVYYSSSTLQNMALTVFTNINNTGGIV